MRETSSLATKECVNLAKMIESVASRAATPFKNESFTDFSRPENRKAQLEALEQVKRELGQKDYKQGHIRLSQSLSA